MRERIGLITTGGTIDKCYGEGIGVVNYEFGVPYAGTFFAEHAGRGIEVVSIPLFAMDSSHMTDEHRHMIVEAIRTHPIDTFIITHGTDSMIKTGLAITRAGLAGLNTVVLTGALQPASMKRSDADCQLGLAMAASQCKDNGIWIA